MLNTADPTKMASTIAVLIYIKTVKHLPILCFEQYLYLCYFSLTQHQLRNETM